MKRRLVEIVTLAVVLAGFGTTVDASRGETDLRARLRGLSEVPPTNSRATGLLRASLSRDEASISFTLEFENLSGNPAAAHIHFGQSKVNGGVMVFFCGGGGKPECPASPSGSVTGTLTAADIVGPAAQGILAAPEGQFADVVRAIRTGNAYANIHTASFQGGEIRGQVVVDNRGD